jgi:phosphoribosylaminoimidazolecarboxamide formyltransferase / IMP cyclohydrolase
MPREEAGAMAVNTVRRIDDRVAVRTVLASVSDKTGLDGLVAGLLALIPTLRILSTGGTHAAVAAVLGRAAPGCLEQVSDYTGQPEMQGGLVKTLDFRIYLGLLSETYNPAHQADLARTGAFAIDMVVVNLYPFEKTVASAGVSPESARGTIDIGGPCMVRAAAKNFHRVAVVTDPADYPAILAELKQGAGALSLATRFALAQKAFRLTARYDAAIADYLAALHAVDMQAAYTVEPGGGRA